MKKIDDAIYEIIDTKIAVMSVGFKVLNFHIIILLLLFISIIIA